MKAGRAEVANNWLRRLPEPSPVSSTIVNDATTSITGGVLVGGGEAMTLPYTLVAEGTASGARSAPRSVKAT